MHQSRFLSKTWLLGPAHGCLGLVGLRYLHTNWLLPCRICDCSSDNHEKLGPAHIHDSSRVQSGVPNSDWSKHWTCLRACNPPLLQNVHVLFSCCWCSTSGLAGCWSRISHQYLHIRGERVSRNEEVLVCVYGVCDF